MDPARPVAQALAVDGGRIVAVGSTNDLLGFPEEASEALDLRGRTVVPGFVDPHNHFSLAALEACFADCRDAADVPAIQKRMAEAARRAPAGAWVRGWGYDHRRLAERRHPTRHELDEAVGDRPALLLHFSHHQAVASSRALALVGIGRASPDPPGGEIGRDRSGEPDGLLFERAMSEAETRSRQDCETSFSSLAREAALAYASHGVTAVQDAAVSPAVAARYAEARRAGALPIHVSEVMVGSAGWFEPPEDPAPGDLKLFVDGGYRCALRTERNGRSEHSGFLFYDAPSLARRLLAAWRGGRRVVCHAIGNAGVETAVAAIEDALRAEPGGRDRVRIDHAIFLDPALIERLAGLGAWVVTQPSFLYDSGDARVPPGLSVRPFRSLADAGVPQAFSSDYPCGTLAPLAGIYAAATRRSRDGRVADPDQAVSVAAALRAYTIDAARAAGLDRECGSLEAGKRADFAVLSENPLEVPAADLLRIQVEETWLRGEPVFRR